MPELGHHPIHIYVFGVYKRDSSGEKDVVVPSSISLATVQPFPLNVPDPSTVASPLVGATVPAIGDLGVLFNLSVTTVLNSNVSYTLQPITTTQAQRDDWYDLLAGGHDVGDGTLTTNLTFQGGSPIQPYQLKVVFHFRGVSADHLLALAKPGAVAEVSQSSLTMAAAAPETGETGDWNLMSTSMVGATAVEGRWQNGLATYSQNLDAGDPNPEFTVVPGAFDDPAYTDGDRSMDLEVSATATNPSLAFGDRNDTFALLIPLQVTMRQFTKDGYVWLDGQLPPADASQTLVGTALPDMSAFGASSASGVSDTSTLAAQSNLAGGAMVLDLDLAITNVPGTPLVIFGNLRLYVSLANYAPTLSPVLDLLQSNASQSAVEVAAGGSVDYSVADPAAGLIVDWDLTWVGGTPPMDSFLGGSPQIGNPLSLSWPGTVAAGDKGTLSAAVSQNGANLASARWQAPELTGVVVLDPTRQVALLLDRSGSMSGLRWDAATDSARCFCAHVAAMNASRPAGQKHSVGIYYYWGSPSAINWTLTNDPAQWHYDPAIAAPHDVDFGTGVANFGVLEDSTATPMPLVEQENGTHYGTKTIDAPVGNYTAIGSGILYARDVLDGAGAAASTGAILALSDGIQNCEPYLESVFDPIASGPAAALYPNGVWADTPGPDYPVYTVALETSAAWAALLSNYSSEVPDGLGGTKPGSKHVTATDIGGAVTKCITAFVEFFQEMFQWAPVVITDPSLSAGQVYKHSIEIGPGYDMLGFTLIGHEKVTNEDGKLVWRIGVKPPGADVIWGDEPEVIQSNGEYFISFTVGIPVPRKGLEHVTVGEWEVHVERLEGAGSYDAHAMLRPEAGAQPPVTVDVDVPDEVEEGDVVDVEVGTFTPGNTKEPPVLEVCEPEPWWGDIIARRLRQGKYLPAGGPREMIKESKQFAPAHEAVIALTEKERPLKRRCRRYRLSERANGKYGLAYPVRTPGTYVMKIIAEGNRGKILPAKFVRAKIDESLALYRPALEKLERLKIDKHWKASRYHIEANRRVQVRLKPHLKTTETSGVLKGKTLTLSVTPRNAKGLYLGPGWEHAVRFVTPWGRAAKLRPHEDGTGTYSVSMKLKVGGSELVPTRRVLIGKKIQAKWPGVKESQALPGKVVNLNRFYVEVLGHKFPIRVEVESFQPDHLLEALPKKELLLKVPPVVLGKLPRVQAQALSRVAAVMERQFSGKVLPFSSAWRFGLFDSLAEIEGLVSEALSCGEESAETASALGANVQYLLAEYGGRELERGEAQALAEDLGLLVDALQPFLECVQGSPRQSST